MERPRIDEKMRCRLARLDDDNDGQCSGSCRLAKLLLDQQTLSLQRAQVAHIFLFIRNRVDSRAAPVTVGHPVPAKWCAGFVTGVERDATAPSRLRAFLCGASR
jgi:hypothetical protein